MRAPVAILLVLAVAACAPQVPESGPGFQDYNSYMRERMSGGGAPASVTIAPSGGFSAEGATAALDRAQGTGGTTAAIPYSDTQGALIGGSASGGAGADGARPRGNAPSNIQEETGEMAHINGNAGISDEQDFSAVSSRESIQSDKERIERNRSQYQVIQPGALPQRTGNEGPNIVQFALQSSHPVGTQMYSRSGRGASGMAAACAKFASPDLAQEWFLSNGGPQKDKRGLDPDGDGYVCTWDPAPFRS